MSVSSSATTGRGSATRGVRTRFELWLERFESPTTTYYGLLGITGLLVGIGLVMVLSASMIESLKESNSSFTIFLKQALFAVIGAVLLWWASRRSIAFWKRVAIPAVLGSILLLVLVFTPLGFGFQGNRNWIALGPVTIQPSEIAKIGLILAGALVLERKRERLGFISHALVPFVLPVCAVIIGLVMLGHDLGTAMVICAIIVGMLFAAGVPTRWFVVGGGLMAAAGFVAVSSGSSRMERIQVWLDPSECTPGTAMYYGICRQPIHGRYALADGGWFGVGLGASREKWGWLPEPYNDFIFAIIGEELGLIGTLTIIGLYVALAFIGMRMVARTEDFFVRLVTAGICTWVLVQAIINIGAVIGMLPVIGVPLPFVSSGGSSLVMGMFAIGVLLSFARHEPGFAEMMAAKPSRTRVLLARLTGRRNTPA
ncbi:putative lipid II flippase FtsW [Janibacter corallicola]|uniref:putative lipid II flippase FtsW n=1 Tax=Janibacter corallicola TaxID=415212 RepID=UPI0012ECFEE2